MIKLNQFKFKNIHVAQFPKLPDTTNPVTGNGEFSIWMEYDWMWRKTLLNQRQYASCQQSIAGDFSQKNISIVNIKKFILWLS